jgi:hypothetical protein
LSLGIPWEYIAIDLQPWANYNISQAWIVGPFWDDFPIKTMIPSEVAVRWLYFTQTIG